MGSYLFLRNNIGPTVRRLILILEIDIPLHIGPSISSLAIWIIIWELDLSMSDIGDIRDCRISCNRLQISSRFVEHSKIWTC